MSNNPKQQGNLHFTLLANNIGPLNDLKYSLDSNNTKKIYCIYANNASGKTFISRCFSLFNLEKDENTLNYLSKNLITFNENSSKFEFCLSTDITKKLTIKLDKNKGITTKTNNTGYIFHVFNEDFIDKNIANEIDKFHNSIKGSYIIGEEAININNLKHTLKTLEEEKDEIISQIKSKVSEKRNKLNEIFKKEKRINEYKLFELEDEKIGEWINKLEKHNIEKELNDYINQYEKIENININEDTNNLSHINDFILYDINENKEYKNIKDDFLNTIDYQCNFPNYFDKEKLNKNHEFFEKGLKLSNGGTTCPFCEQKYNKLANELITLYKNYFNDQEGQLIKKLDHFQNYINNKYNNWNIFINNANAIIDEAEKKKSCFPSLEKIVFKKFNDSFDENLSFHKLKKEIEELISKKKSNINLSINIESILKKWKEWSGTIQDNIKTNNQLIMDINKLLQNHKAEKSSIRKNICFALFNDLVRELQRLKTEHENNSKQIKYINDQIIKKQNLKINKIAKVLNKLFKSFYGDKYEFDEETFRFNFKKNPIPNENLSYVFSQAERNIIGFCYYIASIYKIIDKIEDLDKIFYIIDDPISSMDFNYIYFIPTIIQKYASYDNENNNNNNNGKEYRNNVIVLTHSFEFFNVLMINYNYKGFSLYNGKINELKFSILPYFHHLLDVYNVYAYKNTEINNSHTILTSIRYIIETMQNFQYPNKRKNSENPFIKQIWKDKNNEIFKIINDGSHGSIIGDKIHTNELIFLACEKLVKFMESNEVFKNQITYVKDYLNGCKDE